MTNTNDNCIRSNAARLIAATAPAWGLAAASHPPCSRGCPAAGNAARSVPPHAPELPAFDWVI